MCVETIKKWEWCQRSVGSVRVHGPYSEHVINPGVFRPDVPDVNNLYYISGPRVLVVSQTVNFSLSIMFPHWKHIHQHIFGTRYASVLRLGTYFWATRIHLRQLPLMEFLRCNCWMENGYMFSRVAHSTFDWLMTVNFRWCLTTTFQTVSLIFIPVEKSECGKGWSKGFVSYQWFNFYCKVEQINKTRFLSFSVIRCFIECSGLPYSRSSLSHIWVKDCGCF